MEKQKLYIRIKRKRPCQLPDLPFSILFEICQHLAWPDIEQLSRGNKHMLNAAWRMPFSETALFPLAPYHTPEIQVKATHIVVLKSALLNFSWIDQMLKRYANVTTLEVATIDITGRNKIKGLLKCVLKSNISLVLVNASCVAYWKKVFKSIPRTRQLEFGTLPVDYEQMRSHLLSIDQSADECNPLYSSLSNPSAITGVASWMHPLNEVLLTKLSEFKTEAERLLKRKGCVHTIIEVLSFNSIYFMAPGCFGDYLINISEWQQIVSNCRDKFKTHTCPKEKHNHDAIERFAQTVYYSFSEIDVTIDQFRGTNIDGCILDMLTNLARKINYATSSTCMDEDTFTMQIIDPILNAFINNTIPNINYYGSTHVLHESNIRKYNQERAVGRKADRSVVVKTHSGNIHTVFICEIKTDSKCKGRPDLAKTGAMMKDALDHALLCHVPRKDYSVLGLLIEGSVASVLSLDLPASGLYRLVEVDCFRLPSSIKDMNCLTNSYKALMNLRHLLIKRVELVSDAAPAQNESVLAHLRPTCPSPPYYSDYIE